MTRRASTPTDAAIDEHLAARTVRSTPARRAVLVELLEARGPRSAAELHEAMRRAIPLSSLYRSLTVLEEAGLVIPHHGSRGLTRYEPAEWLSGHHHHLVCNSCGTVEDVEVSAADERRMHALLGSITSRAGFEPAGHTLEIEGRCSRCA